MRKVFFLSILIAVFSFSGCDFTEEFWGSADELSTLRIPIIFTLPERLPIMMPDETTIAGIPADANGDRFLPTCSSASPSEICLPPIYVGDMNLTQFDTSGRLSDAEGFIRAIEISSVTLNVLSNTMNVEMQPIEIRIGDQTGDFYSALTAANTPIIPVGTVGELEGSIVEANRTAIGENLGDFDFGMGMGSTVFIPNGVIPNGGNAEAEVILSLVVVMELIE